jgi:phosphoserine phosphatase RsbU/P
MTAGARKAVLTYSNAEGAHTFTLDGPTVSIGRSPDQDLVLTDTFVSRRHALLRQTALGFEVEDLASSHGTYLNGAPVRTALLRSGDVLQFGSPGSMKVHFRILDEDHPHAPLAGDLISTLGQISAGRLTPAQEISQLNFLLNAARRLNAGYATRDILHALLQLSIQLTGAERGFVLLFKPAGGPATAHDHKLADLHLGLGLSAAGEFLSEDSTVSRSAIRKAIDNSAKFTISDTWSNAQSSPTDSVVVNSIRSIYCIPLRRRAVSAEPDHSPIQSLAPSVGLQPDKKSDQHRGQLLGVLYLDSRASTGRLNTIDHELLDTISTEAAILLDHALLVESEQKARKAAEELDIAARIHAGLMPATLPSSPFAAMQARTIPCHAIGGDFYDAIVLPDALGLVIADVSGKGVPASIVAATIQGIIHAQMLTGQPLDQIAALINRFLCERSVGKYATLVLMKLHPSGRLEYVNCGHVAPLRVSAPQAEPLLEGNLIVGLLPQATYSLAITRLAPGERILLATDGIPEAFNAAGEEFGQERFHAAACLDAIDAIFDRVAKFQGDCPSQDDLTLLDLRYLGPPNQEGLDFERSQTLVPFTAGAGSILLPKTT